ncbi:hypothetical protein C2G38_2223847 [Gigaspora rosea]|uniref:Uncharacterized protein n=1 Tax=Gigaspora rosea TaxID=44941 RepID=A0A397U9A3_9GLOM|nr:hypothetical protein C2G38_2223847 [Gigaspora rosea]
MEIDEALQNKREQLYNETSSESEEETSTTNTSNSLSSTNSQSSTNTSNSQSSTNTSNLQSSTNKNKKRTRHFHERKVSKIKSTFSPNDISQYWREKLAEITSNYIRKPKNPVLLNPILQTLITSHFMFDRPLPKAVVDQLDQKILKGWIMAGIPFDVIENPFIQDMFKVLQPAYNPPSRSILSDRLLDEELA